MPEASSFSWYHTDYGVDPDALVREPWTKEGTFSPAYVDDGLDITDSGAGRASYYKQLFAADRATGPKRFRDRIEIQGYVRGISNGAAWAGGASPIMLYIDDGLRALGVSIGSTLQLVDPYTGQAEGTVKNNHAWTRGAYYRLIKKGTDCWELWVGPERLFIIPYVLAPASLPANAPPAVAGFGCRDPAGTARAVFEGIEVGLNRAVAPQWKVQRIFNTLPPPIQRRWTVEARALVRAAVALVETPLEAMTEAWNSITARKFGGRIAFAFDGDLLPSLVSPAWTLLTAADLAVQRERLHINAQGVALTGVSAVPSSSAGGNPSHHEWRCGGDIQVYTYTPDAQGRVGPHVKLRDASRLFTAQLIEEGASLHYWVFTDAVITGGPLTEIGRRWYVDARREHSVEIRAWGVAHVALIIDQQIVDRVPYSDFPSLGGGPDGVIESAVGPVCVWTLARAFFGNWTADLKRRPAFEQNMLERLIWTSGCDRNDELETWGWAHHEAEALRGTTVGILVELRRLACCEDVQIVVDTEPASWFLEASWPEVTPIFLEAEGTVADVWVEFCFEGRNFTPQTLADLAAHYLVPISTLELEYFIALTTLLTGAPTVPGPGLHRLAVKNSANFAVGDEVSVRDASNTTSEDTTISAIPSSTTIDVPTLSGTYGTDGAVRKILATT